MVDELKDLDTLTQSSLVEPFSQFQISADLISITAGLLGGGGDGDFHFGIQAKYLRNKMGYRFQLEFYPQTTTNWGNSRPIEIVGNEIIYLVVNENAQMLRSGFGIERGRPSKYGRSYYGIDMPITYQQNQLSAFTCLDDPSSDEPRSFSMTSNTEMIRYLGFGLRPFIGYEIHAGKRFGFNLKAKADFNFMVAEGYFVDDNAVITKSGQSFNFRTFPLLDFRIHYRI